MQRTAQYPYHLAKLVSARLRAENRQIPPESVLTRLIETLYFASLKTDEGRPVLCTVNYVDPAVFRNAPANGPSPVTADCWSLIPFQRPLPFDVRTLSRLARAADPAVSSLAVYSDKNHKLYIWGMVDQELRYSDFIALDAAATPDRPGTFQATVMGVGNVSVYVNYALVGSLEQNTLIQEYHDALWSGPVHDILQSHPRSYLASLARQAPANSSGWPEVGSPDYRLFEDELLVRWLNAICRILMNIQGYRHGGGLLILGRDSLEGLNVKYKIRYDRLQRALVGIAQNEFLRGRLAAHIDRHCRSRSDSSLPSNMHYELRSFRRKFDEHKSEVVGCTHFIASLSCVDGFVLLDRGMTAHGFGVEVRSDHPLTEVYVAGDCHADPNAMRPAELSQYGTRHRAMMRYCFAHDGALGFVVSQDGDIRAMTRIDGRLVLWENIEVQLAFRAENGFLLRHDLPHSSVPQPSVADSKVA